MPTIKIQGEEVEIEFYREDVKEHQCPDTEEYECGRSAQYVNIDDADDVVCNKHRLEMTPGARRRYIKIEDIPFKNPPRSASEAAFNGNDEDDEDDDYELTDEEAEAALVNGE